MAGDRVETCWPDGRTIRPDPYTPVVNISTSENDYIGKKKLHYAMWNEEIDIMPDNILSTLFSHHFRKDKEHKSGDSWATG